MGLCFVTETPKHSLLIYYRKKEVGKETINKMGELLAQGVKVIFVSPYIQKLEFVGLDIEDFKSAKLLQFYKSSTQVISNDIFYIVDGVLDKKQEEWLCRVSNDGSGFNYEQYIVEHASLDMNLSVEAGAGTGKTTVMIERILFLLHMDNVLKPQDIVMITFTRDATQHMKHKIQEAFLKRYALTKQVRYLEYLENLSLMRIQTIPAFAKYLISETGAIRGYGKDVSIKGYSYERIKLINKIIDAHFMQKNLDDRITSILKMPLYYYVNMMEYFWNQFENKGLSFDDMKKFQWGNAKGEDAEKLHEVISNSFIVLEEEFQKMKKRDNAIGLSDITRELDIIKEEVENLASRIKPIKYLFVDEFQDTDNTQIELVAWIQKQLGTRLLVVGDIKQSIYRFRGANYTAFEQLKKYLAEYGEKTTNFELKKNYRTSSDVLNELGKYFDEWGRKSQLVYGEKNVLIPMNHSVGKINIQNSNTKEGMNRRLLVILNDSIDELKKRREMLNKNAEKTKDEKVAVLVRANWQVSEIKKLCDENGIPCHVEKGGNFYSSIAVKDFFIMIMALLFPNEPLYQINLYGTPYTLEKLDWRVLWEQNGSKMELENTIKNMGKSQSWRGFVNNFRLDPVFSVLRKILNDTKPEKVFYTMEIQRLSNIRTWKEEDILDEARKNAIQYKKNLNHLLELLREKFSEESTTLYGIYEFLKIQIPTNREENEPELDEEEIKDNVYCMTVHKSKGLEFDTVIIPFTDNEFYKDDRNEIIMKEDPKGWKIGWKVDTEEEQYMNDCYSEIVDEELNELTREETRLLYVALTRTIRRLEVIKKGDSDNSWAGILEYKGGVR